jgi:hypothetical protein
MSCPVDEQEFRSILSDYEKMNDAARKEIAALREAIAAWPEIGHGERCDVYVFCHPPLECDCGADESNAARVHARRVVGLGEP